MAASSAHAEDSGSEDELEDQNPVPDVLLPSEVLDVRFAPVADRYLLAAGLIDGSICTMGLQPSAEPGKGCSVPMARFDFHSGAVRELQFSNDACLLFSASSDRSIGVMDMNSGQLLQQLPRAATSGISRLARFEYGNSGNLLAAGDDMGGIRVWDIRQQPKPAFELDGRHTEYIAALEPYVASHALLSTSGDGTLAHWDLRKRACVHQSENVEDELLSCKVMQHGNRVVCGTQSGVLAIFTWGNIGDMTGRFVGHPESVDTLLKIDEETLLTGSADGLIRVVTVEPNRLIGVMGGHDDGCPVEALDFSPDRRLLVSCSHDRTVKVWDATFLSEEDSDSQAGSDRGLVDLGPLVASGDGPGNSDDDADSDSDVEMAEPDDQMEVDPNKRFFAGL